MIAKLAASLTLIILAAGVCREAEAYSFLFGTPLGSSGWDVHTPRGKKAATFEVTPDGVLTIDADAAVSFFYQTVPEEVAMSRSLSWRWRVLRDFEPTDLSVPGSDDRPIAFHVYFADPSAALSRKLMGGLGRLFGVPVSGRVITYVWGGREVPGTVIANPFMDEGEGVLIIRRPSGSDAIAWRDGDGSVAWRDEKVDLTRDYKMAFGTEATAVRAIAVSSDTDDTAAVARSQISEIELKP